MESGHSDCVEEKTQQASVCDTHTHTPTVNTYVKQPSRAAERESVTSGL